MNDDSAPRLPQRRSQTLTKALVLTWFGAVAVLIALSLAGVQPLNGMRRDFVAVRCAQTARTAAFSAPVHRTLAVSNARRAIAFAPSNADVVSTAADVFMKTEDYGEAMKALLALAKLTGTTPLKQLGMCYLMTGLSKPGEAMLEQVVRAQAHERSSGPGGRLAYATTLNDVGYFYALAGRELARSLSYTSQAVELQPMEPAFIDSLGWAYFRLGQYDNAAFHLERAARLSVPESDPEMAYHLGVVYARQGRQAEAQRELGMALKLDPDNKNALYELRRLNWNLPPPVMAQACVKVIGG